MQNKITLLSQFLVSFASLIKKSIVVFPVQSRIPVKTILIVRVKLIVNQIVLVLD